MADQVEATVLKIGQAPLLLIPQSSSFPTQEIIISEVVDDDINSSITCNGVVYYCSETKDTLVTAANAGGGGGDTPLSGTMISYQNSAMSTAVDAYVFKDADDNITRVYEPVRNNDVSRSQFAYIDSIDKFPFDNVYLHNNKFSDIKIVNPHASNIYQNNTLSNLVIDTLGAGSNPLLIASVDQLNKTFTLDVSFGDRYDLVRKGIIVISDSTGNDGVYTVASAEILESGATMITVNETIPSSVADGGISGFQLKQHIQSGNFGIGATHSAEFYITGDMVKIVGNQCGGGSFDGGSASTFFDSIGDYSFISGNTFGNKVSMLGRDRTFRFFTNNTLTSTTIIDLFNDGLSYCTLNTFISCQINIQTDPTVDGDIYSGVNNNLFSQESVVNISKQIVNCNIGANVQLTPVVVLDGENYLSVNGVTKKAATVDCLVYTALLSKDDDSSAPTVISSSNGFVGTITPVGVSATNFKMYWSEESFVEGKVIVLCNAINGDSIPVKCAGVYANSANINIYTDTIGSQPLNISLQIIMLP